MNRRSGPLPLLLVALAVAGLPAPVAHAFTQLVVFGDSLSDTGNIDVATFGIVPGSGYVNGRFSDGPVWVEDLAMDLGLATPAHDLKRQFLSLVTGNGSNYAVGGALTRESGDLLSFDDMNEQVARYLGSKTPTGNELFVLLGGANNINDSQSNVGAIASDLTGYVTSLYNVGARHVLVSNLPPIGRTPGNLGTSGELTKTQLTIDFNAAYDAQLDALELTLPLLDLHRMDFYGLTRAMLEHPELYGFTNITDPGMDDPAYDDDFAFWDDIHPTRRFHRLIADLARVAVAGALPGDANSDGVVDELDVRFVETYFGTSAPSGAWLAGDANGNGVVDGADYLAVQANFGAQWSAVPEPGLACLPLLVVMMRRRLSSRGVHA